MKEKVMQIPSEKAFSLEKVKLAKDGGIDAQYEVTETSGGESYLNHYTVNNTKEIHPDLRKLFDELKPIVARVFGMTSFLTFIEAEENKIKPDVKVAARAFAEELLEKIEVRGISLSGVGDNVGVIITSIYEVANGLKTCINTPRIKMATISFGFEEELEKIIRQVEREVYAFLFEGKQAQMSLFGESAEASNDVPEDM